MTKSQKAQEYYWHEAAGARILLPKQLIIKQPLPELYATSRKPGHSLLITITSNENVRQSTEHQILGPHRGHDKISVETLRQISINEPYPGIECVIQLFHLHKPIPDYDYYWDRLLYLDKPSGVVAWFRLSAFKPFSEDESLSQTVMNSFSWDRENAVVLKFDGDEVALRKKYLKKKKTKIKVVPNLPTSLLYLQSAINELFSLPPEEVNEDLDLTELFESLEQRVKGLTLAEAEDLIDEDCNTLEKWITEDIKARSTGYFVHSVMDAFHFHLGDSESGILKP